jgi:hypothetical protein
MKRNTIVYSKHDDMVALYGRVNRIFSDGMVETIDCGKFIRVSHPDDLVVVEGYKGRWETSYYEDSVNLRFHRMPTLRKLKQMTSCFDKTVWKKHRKGDYCDETQFMEKFEGAQR